MTVPDLEEYLSLFDAHEEVMVRIRLPDIDFEVCDWAITYLDFPDVIRRLRALVDRAAYYNFVD